MKALPFALSLSASFLASAAAQAAPCPSLVGVYEVEALHLHLEVKQERCAKVAVALKDGTEVGGPVDGKEHAVSGRGIPANLFVAMGWKGAELVGTARQYETAGKKRALMAARFTASRSVKDDLVVQVTFLDERGREAFHHELVGNPLK